MGGSFHLRCITRRYECGFSNGPGSAEPKERSFEDFTTSIGIAPHAPGEVVALCYREEYSLKKQCLTTCRKHTIPPQLKAAGPNTG
jgi:hypothetical protein